MKPAALILLAAGLAAAQTMTFPAKEWEEAAPESQGVDSRKLEDAVAWLRKRTGRDGVDELVIVRYGRMIWKGPRIDDRHGVWSVTKSFTSTVLGVLIDDGRCKLDTRAMDHLTALAAAYPRVTLRHFATMTSGYRAMNDEPRGAYRHGPSATWYEPNPWPLFSPPGSRYAYWDSAMNEFANVLTRIAGEPIEELFERRIAGPIGMNREKWDWGDFGRIGGIVVNGGSGNWEKHMFISARELARFGHLFLNRGYWDGRQLISANWVKQATRVQVRPSIPLAHEGPGLDGRGVYGFNWWVNGVKPDGKRKWPGAPHGTFAAHGAQNNRLWVIPEWKMVIVRMGLDGAGGALEDATASGFLERVGEAIGK